jgi:hypothetical protein
LNDGGVWEIALKDLSHRCTLDEGKLNTKANDNTKDENNNENLKSSQTFHGAIGTVKHQNKEDVKDGDGAASYKGYLWN